MRYHPQNLSIITLPIVNISNLSESWNRYPLGKWKVLHLKNDKKYQEALQAYNKAIELDGNYSFAYYNRAKLFVMMNSKGKACQDFQTALELGLSYAQAKVANKFVAEMNCLITD